LVQDHRPTENRRRPLLGYIPSGQEKEFSHGFFIRKATFGFDHFAQLPIIVFDRIRRMDQAADLGRIIKESRQILIIQERLK
jgi:hypothetical protein